MKIRTTVFGGSRRIIVWDDMNSSARLMVHDRGVDRVTLPVTERLTAGSLILPLFHEMTEKEQDVVVSVMQAATSSRRRVKAS